MSLMANVAEYFIMYLFTIYLSVLLNTCSFLSPILYCSCCGWVGCFFLFFFLTLESSQILETWCTWILLSVLLTASASLVGMNALTTEHSRPGYLLWLVLVFLPELPALMSLEGRGEFGDHRDNWLLLLSSCISLFSFILSLAYGKGGSPGPGREGECFPWILTFGETLNGSFMPFVSGLPDVVKGIPSIQERNELTWAAFSW